MRIAMIADLLDIPSQLGGGVEIHVYELSRHLIKRGCDVDIYTGGGSQQTNDINGVIVHRLNIPRFPIAPFTSQNIFLGIKFKYFQNKKFDIVHAHIYPSAYFSSLGEQKQPLVYTEHFWDVWLPSDQEIAVSRRLIRMFQKRIAQDLYQRSNRVIFLSEYTKNEICKRVGIKQEKVFVIPHGVNTIMFNPKKKDISIFQKYGINNDRPKILFVGRLDPEKGLVYLFHAMKKVLTCCKADLIIVGSSFLGSRGSQEKELKILCKRLNISENVHFLGKVKADNLVTLYKGLECLIKVARSVITIVPNVLFINVGGARNDEGFRYLCFLKRKIQALNLSKHFLFISAQPRELLPFFINSADVMAYTSKMDNYHWSLVESLSCGKPIVATDIGATKEIVYNMKNGILVKSEDVAKISNAIGLLLTDSTLRVKLGQGARDHIEKYHSRDVILPILERLYEQISSGSLSNS